MTLAVGLTIVSAIPALIVAAPLLVLTYELVVGIWPIRLKFSGFKAVGMNAVVLIPAHNEVEGISKTLDLLHAGLPENISVLVVADNCDDNTAMTARLAGAEVIERFDTVRKSKGYALEFGRDFLALQSVIPDVVIVLDADCRPVGDAMETLASQAYSTNNPVQATNLCEPSLDEHPMVQISNFAMLVKNLYRSRGMQRVGGAALLTGTGMAFPWHLFASADLGTSSLVEDLRLGIALTRSGHPPQLVESAVVLSDSAAADDLLGQRRRWEHGFLEALRHSALPSLAGGLARRSPSEVLLGLHLLVPPIALLLGLAMAAFAFTALMSLCGAAFWPVELVGGASLAALVVIILAWFDGGHRYLTAAALLRAPLYVLWKLKIYTSFVRRVEDKWIRTPRRAKSETTKPQKHPGDQL